MSFHPQTDNYKYWTLEEDRFLENIVRTGKSSFKNIGKILGRTGVSCQKRSTALGFKNKFIKRIYSQDENFWETPNLLNCYWAGFSAADANIYQRGANYTYRLELGIIDKERLESLKEVTQFDGKIFECKKRKNNTVRITINSNKWAKDLSENFNIIPNKTKRLKPPILHGDLKLAWLIGYIDGDGCIHLNKYNKQLSISFVSSSEEIIKFVSELFDEYWPTGLRRKLNPYYKKEKYSIYRISGIRAAIAINKLSKIDVPKLYRKWKNPEVLERIDWYKQNYPSFFV